MANKLNYSVYMPTPNRQTVHIAPLLYSGYKVRANSVPMDRVARFFKDVDEQTIDDKDCSDVEWICNGEKVSPIIGYMHTELLVASKLMHISAHSRMFPNKY